MKLYLFLLIFTIYTQVSGKEKQEQTYNFSTTYNILALIAENKTIVDAVLKSNNNVKTNRDMNNDTWKLMSSNHNLVLSYMNNEAAKVLEKLTPSYVTEAFISNERGEKVAFLSKTTSWTHKGQDKHEYPMHGKNWQGSMEKDKSTGIHQIQISGPIYYQKKVIGSLVLGISVAKWEIQQNAN